MRRSSHATRNGVGTYVQMEFEVIAGDHRGRRLWDRFTMEHPNPKAVDMGRLQLASLCRAVGKASPTDSSDLHDVPVVAIVTREPRKDTGELVNRIKGYEAAGGPPVIRPSIGGNGHAGGTSRKPWERGIAIWWPGSVEHWSTGAPEQHSPTMGTTSHLYSVRG